MTQPTLESLAASLDPPCGDAASQTTAPDVTGEGTDGAAEMTAGADLTCPPPPGVPTVVGLDLSLSSTGVAADQRHCTLRVPSLTRGADYGARARRLRVILGMVAAECVSAQIVVMEGPAFSKGADPGSHERAGLWWLVYNWLAFGQQVRSLPRVVVVGPSSLKKYATGKGNAGKPQVIAEAIRRLGYSGHDDNECDALWLRAMALDALGHPLCSMPAVNRAALDKVDWPELVTP